VIGNGFVPAGTVVNSSSLFPVPPGPATILLAASAGTVFVGAGTVTAVNGFPVVGGLVQPVTIPAYPGSPGARWSALAPGGTATLSWIISDPTGQTGTGTLG
jgi:hypothetical protein